MKRIIVGLFILLITILTGVNLFMLKSKDKQKLVLEKLFQAYKDGTISECYYQGNRVYFTSINAYDAVDSIYDSEGKNIGLCNYAWGKPDKICEELKNCERIYLPEKNIWGYPPVNKYNLK